SIFISSKSSTVSHSIWGPLGKRKISYVKPVSLAGITKSERLHGTDRHPNTIKMRRKKQVT
ncbi:hypothetical protein, partial [Klebsiella pneumoniae]|uniref:hypothetical protein n=1 Tax=Klebsiella pneumoniae TaxID=573 RepID=UPI00210DBD3F